MDPDTLFGIVVLVSIIAVFALGVTIGCGCTYWRQRATNYWGQTQRYKIEVTGETRSHPEINRKVKERPSKLINALSLEVSQFELDRLAFGPGKVFRTKEQLRRTLQASRHLGTRPDTSRVVKKPTD